MTEMPRCPFCGSPIRRVDGNYAYPAGKCTQCNEVLDLIAVGMYWKSNDKPGNIVGFKDRVSDTISKKAADELKRKIGELFYNPRIRELIDSMTEPEPVPEPHKWNIGEWYYVPSTKYAGPYCRGQALREECVPISPPKFEVGKRVKRISEAWQYNIEERKWSPEINRWLYRVPSIGDLWCWEEWLTLVPEPPKPEWKVGDMALCSSPGTRTRWSNKSWSHTIYGRVSEIKGDNLKIANGHSFPKSDCRRVLALHIEGDPIGPGMPVITPEGWCGIVISHNQYCLGNWNVGSYRHRRGFPASDLTPCTMKEVTE